MPRTLEVSLRLESVHDLFRAPGITPLSPHFGLHSTGPALEYIADEIYADSSYEHIHAVFDVPADEMATLSDEDVRAGIRRWADARAHENAQDVSATRWRGLRSLIAGAAAFAAFVGLSEVIGEVDGDLATTVSRGMEVAAWVVLWFPIDLLIFSLWEHRLDRRAARLVGDMDVTLTTR